MTMNFFLLINDSEWPVWWYLTHANYKLFIGIHVQRWVEKITGIILDVIDITMQTIDNQYFVAKKFDYFKKMLTQILLT